MPDDRAWDKDNSTDLVKEELMRHQLNERREDQHTRRDSVQHPRGNRGVPRRHGDGGSSSEPDGHPERGDERVQDTTEEGDPGPVGRQTEERKSGAESETFEHLVEDDHDEEHVELRSRKRKGGGGAGAARETKVSRLRATRWEAMWRIGTYLLGSSKRKRQSDRNRVEDDSKLEHRNTEDLSSSGQSLRGILVRGDRVDALGVLLVQRSVAVARSAGERVGGVSGVSVGVSVRVGVGVHRDAELLECVVAEAEGDHLDDEGDEDRGEADTELYEGKGGDNVTSAGILVE